MKRIAFSIYKVSHKFEYYLFTLRGDIFPYEVLRFLFRISPSRLCRGGGGLFQSICRNVKILIEVLFHPRLKFNNKHPVV